MSHLDINMQIMDPDYYMTLCTKWLQFALWGVKGRISKRQHLYPYEFRMWKYFKNETQKTLNVKKNIYIYILKLDSIKIKDICLPLDIRRI